MNAWPLRLKVSGPIVAQKKDFEEDRYFIGEISAILEKTIIVHTLRLAM